MARTASAGVVRMGTGDARRHRRAAPLGRGRRLGGRVDARPPDGLQHGLLAEVLRRKQGNPSTIHPWVVCVFVGVRVS
eukprot:scaffold88333_cov28-Tisochrysis_lutea.AAC.2